LERWIKPRFNTWIHRPHISVLHTLLLGFLSFLLVCPVPGLIPLTNSLPSYAIIAIAAGVMEEDGICLVCGYVLTLVTTVYFALIAGGILGLLIRYYEDILNWLRQLV